MLPPPPIWQAASITHATAAYTCQAPGQAIAAQPPSGEHSTAGLPGVIEIQVPQFSAVHDPVAPAGDLVIAEVSLAVCCIARQAGPVRNVLPFLTALSHVAFCRNRSVKEKQNPGPCLPPQYHGSNCLGPELTFHVTLSWPSRIVPQPPRWPA
jgi:hypothetical protein